MRLGSWGLFGIVRVKGKGLSNASMQVLTEIELQVCVCVCVGHCYSLTVSADTTSITLSYPSLFPFPSLLISALIFLKISFFLLCELLVMKVQV